MKKIFALTISMILLITILIPVVSSCPILNSTTIIAATGTKNDAIILEKTIKDGDNWVNTYHANPGEIIHFRIKVTYNDWDGSGKGYMLKNITIVDKLPSKMKYLGNSNYKELNISPDNKTISWYFGKRINNTESVSVEYDAVVNDIGMFVNNVDVTAIESCYGESRNKSTQATVIISECVVCPAINCRDIDKDGNMEYAIDQNGNTSDGYEVFQDPDGSSTSIKSIDGDNDSKIDHFIDINKDGIPDKYWDPDDDILSDIYKIDVDYDGTIEWVYDSNDDFARTPDKYFDPNDQQIHDYIVYTLNINIIGNGTIQKDPNGTLFLKDFVVKLTAIADFGWKFINYSGDKSSNNKIISITMDSDKEIQALFTNNGGDLPTVNITKPKPNYLYFFDIGIGFKSFKDKTEIIGPITVRVKAESDKGIEKVEFYLNGELKKTDKYKPYTWLWLFKPRGDEKNYTISVIAYDKDGKTNTDSVTVTRSQFIKHPIITLGFIGLAGYLLSHKGTANVTKPVKPNNNGSNQAPIIDAGGPYTGIVGKPVNFDASKTYDPEGDSLTYAWDFGDGNTGSGVNPTHTYYKEGKYQVKLTVTDSNGNFNSDTIEVEITNSQGLISGIEGDLFWYIVSGLAVAITIAVGLLYFGRKLYV